MSERLRIISAIRTPEIIGRGRERKAIREAIEDDRTRILYLRGRGGIGKTRLLEEVSAIAEESANKEDCLWGDIIDLYDTANHSGDGLEAAIIRGLDPKEKRFANYRERRKEFVEGRVSASPERLEELRKKKDEAFLADYNKLSKHKRPILCFDTLELIQYERDPVQSICGIEKFGLEEVQSWLSDRASQMSNTMIILAGRPEPKLYEDLVRSQLVNPEDVYDLGGLSLGETKDYLDTLASSAEPEVRAAVQAIDDEGRELIHLYTEGRPIMLSLVLITDWVVKRAPVFDEIITTPLEELKADDKKLAEAREWLEKEIAGVLLAMDPDNPIALALCYAAWARKGLNAELLTRMSGLSVEESTKVLDDLKGLAFVKTRPGTDLIFLHDEMYELMDEHILKDQVEERDQVSQKIIEYYDGEIKKMAPASDIRQNLIVDRLYYQLLKDPKSGYEEYCWLDDEAIDGHEFNYDMRLRDEILRFFRHPVNEKRAKMHGLPKDSVDKDCAVRWVKRYIARLEYERALRIIEDIQASDASLFATKEVLFETELLTVKGKAMALLGRADMDETVGTLKDAINLLVSEETVRTLRATINPSEGELDIEETLGTLKDAINLFEGKASLEERIGKLKTAINLLEVEEGMEEVVGTLKTAINLLEVEGDVEEAVRALKAAIELLLG